MADTTQWITMKVDEFFREIDDEMVKIYLEKNPQRLFQFIIDYIEQFPTPARYIYEKIFEKNEQLHKHYTDYTLTMLKPGAEAVKWVEKCRKAHQQKEEEYPQKLETYKAEKEAYEKAPENHPRKPKAPDIVWPFYVAFYNDQIIATALKEKGIAIKSDWKKIIAEPGYQFMQGAWKGIGNEEADDLEKNDAFVPNVKKANTVRTMMFNLAFALDWNKEILSNMLTKLLLQADVNPKDPMEAVYWYCLVNGISYCEMCSEYLDYIKSDEFKETYAVGFASHSGVRRDTVFFKTKLEEVLKMGKEVLFNYIWDLKYGNIYKDRKTPSEIYWENFRCFPKKVWTGKLSEAQAVVTKTDINQLELSESRKFEEDDETFTSLEDIIEAIILLNPEKARKGSEDEHIDYLVAGTHKVFLYSEEEYQKILSLILEKNRKNYFTDNTETLLPPDKLKIVFGNLVYSNVENRKSGKTSLSRTDIIATKFISFFSDLFDMYPELNQKKRPKWSLFRKLVNEDLEACGFYQFYPRNPFELFIILCFWQEDPFAYFMASWEASKKA